MSTLLPAEPRGSEVPGGWGVRPGAAAQFEAPSAATATLLDHTVYMPAILRQADLNSGPSPAFPTPIALATPSPTATPQAQPTATSTPRISEYGAALVTKSAPSQMLPGERATATADFKNTGVAPWYNTGSSKVVLGTQPTGRISAFHVSESWLDMSTPAALDQYRVEPGQTGRFVFFLVAPGTPGDSFRECFSPLVRQSGGSYWPQALEACFDIAVMAPTPTPTPPVLPTPTPIQPTATASPTPTATPQPPLSLPAPHGVWVYSTSFSAGRTRIQDMGAKWVRVPVAWRDIEPTNTTPSGFNWQKYDTIFAQAGSAGLMVIANIMDNPGWAATYINGPIDKVGLDEYAQFLNAAVNRYKGAPYNVKFWEITNEPDNTLPAYANNPEAGISMWGDDPMGYVNLLSVAYEAVKTADPQSQLMLGSLAMDWFTDEGGPFNRNFLDQVLTNGGGQYFDVVGFHYFPVYFTYRWNQYGKDILGKVAFIRQILAQHNVDKALLASEVGMWSDEGRGGNLEVQAEYVPKVMSRAMAADLMAAVWFMLMDDAGWSDKHGLLNPDYSPKPAYHAYRTFTTQLQGMEYDGTLAVSGSGWELEGYSFVDSAGNHTSVVWRDSGSTSGLRLAGSRVQRTDLYGAVSEHADADDGLVDGYTSVEVGTSPVYLRVLP